MNLTVNLTVNLKSGLPLRTFLSACALGLLSVFLAGPTPGNVGGCSGHSASLEIDASKVSQSAESEYFDQGLCAYTCLKLRECKALCRALGNPPGCTDNDSDSYARCVRGELKSGEFGVSACPHRCDLFGAQFIGAYRWDAQACGEAVLTRSCDGIYSVLSRPPSECLNVCQ